ncbi:MAG TPA: hypothetical protein VIH86_06460 [Puia sp.]
MAKTKHPADFNQKAKSIVDLVTGQSEDKTIEKDEIKSAAAALGRLGGLKGGKARAKSLTAKKRSDIAKKAANARWRKKK